MPLYTSRQGDTERWEQDFCKRYITTTATWADILRCVEALSTDGAKYAVLHRAEGGFMCTRDADFESTEPESGGCPPPNGVLVRKAIRFLCPNVRVDWPSMDHQVCDDVERDDVVIPPGTVISLRFEGQNCRPWPKGECDRLAEIVAASLGWTPTRRRGARGPW
jgi:hypothetical protein